MERYKRRFSLDAPIPFTAARRQSEPVLPRLENGEVYLPTLNRRYSTALNAPVATVHGRRSFDKKTSQDYSTNSQVRRLSLSLALQEALAEEYGCTPVYGIPLVYTPPPEKLHTSTYYLVLKNAKIGDNSTDQNNNAEINDN